MVGGKIEGQIQVSTIFSLLFLVFSFYFNSLIKLVLGEELVIHVTLFLLLTTEKGYNWYICIYFSVYFLNMTLVWFVMYFIIMTFVWFVSNSTLVF
jgi:hypothetical protein